MRHLPFLLTLLISCLTQTVFAQSDTTSTTQDTIKKSHKRVAFGTLPAISFKDQYWNVDVTGCPTRWQRNHL